MSRPTIPFFTDHNVADSAGDALRLQGHTLVRLRECMAPDSKDPLVAVSCLTNGYVLVSHDNDFRAIAKRLEATNRQVRSKFHRVDLRCHEPAAARRLTEVMRLIESEFLLAKAQARSLVIEVHNSFIKVHR